MRFPAIRRPLAALAGAILLAASLTPAAVSPAAADGGTSFVSVVNDYRADHQRPPVSWHALIDDIAVRRAQAMAAARDLNHDIGYVKERLADAGICWQRIGEIVAYNSSGSISQFGEQWYRSTSGHKEIMLNPDYTHAGGSRAAGGGRWWAVMVFVDVCGASAGGSGFTDIGSSKFYDDIVWLAEEGITAGCDAHRFCPDGLVSRAQMASFLSRAAGLPPASFDYFRDDDRSSHEPNINSVARADITAGCDRSRYCPSGLVTRAQMASFLVRALNLPATSHDFFRDDNGSPHEDNINRLAAAGITGGCAANSYCPDGLVTRGQMAAFLHRGFE